MVDTKALRAFIHKDVRVRLSPAAPFAFAQGKLESINCQFTPRSVATKRGLAQLARAFGLGPKGQRFKSSVPDKIDFSIAIYSVIPLKLQK